MKLLVLHSELGVLRGGGENFTRNLFTSFIKRGHQVSAAFVASTSGRYLVPLPSGIVPIPVCGWWSSTPGHSLLSFLERSVPSRIRSTAVLERVKDSMQWRGWRWHTRRFKR